MKKNNVFILSRKFAFLTYFYHISFFILFCFYVIGKMIQEELDPDREIVVNAANYQYAKNLQQIGNFTSFSAFNSKNPNSTARMGEVYNQTGPLKITNVPLHTPHIFFDKCE